MHTIIKRKEILWSVVDEAFDPTEHEFFKNAKEMNQSGFVKMFECYGIGIGCSSTATAPVSMITTQPLYYFHNYTCNNNLGHSATKPDKVNIGITKNYRDK